MIPSDKAHMSSLVNSLNYRHSGRTLSTLPYNLVKNVKIMSSESSDDWVHMVFSLDKKYLRNNALAFNEFKKSTMGQSMFKAFSFFIQLSYDIQNESKGADFACFLEWVIARKDSKCSIALQKNKVIEYIFYESLFGIYF
jgi:hypothetical protein